MGFLVQDRIGGGQPNADADFVILGMLPVAIGMLLQMRWKLDRNAGSITCGLLSGVATGLGTLGYYAALREPRATLQKTARWASYAIARRSTAV